MDTHFDDPAIAMAHRSAVRSIERVVTETAPPTPDAAGRIIAQLRNPKTLIITGAGISTDSGIPDYRSANGRLTKGRPMTFQEFAHSPAQVHRYWARAFVGMHYMRQAQPNRAHYALVELERAGLIRGIVTQNVDGLHQFAGSHDVAELHGSAAQAVCLNHECQWRAYLAVHLDESRDPSDPAHYGIPHKCPACGAPTRPDIVLFGEMLPTGVLEHSENATRNCDVFLAVGTSNTVAPAALLAPLARACGAVTVCIDPYADSARLAGVYDYVVREDAHTVLTRWADRRLREKRNPFLDPF